MSAALTNRPISRLEMARLELVAARTEHGAAFSTTGFSPARADKADSRLAAAQAVFEDEVEWDRGQGERRRREAKVVRLEGQLAYAMRGLRQLEWKLRDACRAANIETTTRSLAIEDIAAKLSSVRSGVEDALNKRDLKPTRRKTLVQQSGLLAEAEYRLGFVKSQTDEVRRIEGDIALLRGDC